MGRVTISEETMRRLLTGLFVLSLFALAARGHAQEPASFDVLITGARVLDGTGNPWFRADIAVRLLHGLQELPFRTRQGLQLVVDFLCSLRPFFCAQCPS